MSIQISIGILLFGLLQSVLVSVAILGRKSRQPASIYLVLFLAVVALQLIFKVISKAWLWEHARTVYMVSYNFGYLVGPLIFLLIRSQRMTPLFAKRDWLHFIPFVLSLALTVADEWFGIIFRSPLASVLPWPSMQLLSLSGYCVAAWRLTSVETGDMRKRMRAFVLFVGITEILIVITIAIMVRNFQKLPDIRFVFILLSLLVYWITYQLIALPGYLSEPQLRTAPKSPMPKYANSGLREEQKDRIKGALIRLIDEEHVFLQAGISIDDVADTLSVSRHHLSQVVNQYFGRSFTDLINSWRLTEATKRLTDPANREQKISSIAFDLGFSSVSAFTTLFKKHFKITPSEFRRRGTCHPIETIPGTQFHPVD